MFSKGFSTKNTKSVILFSTLIPKGTSQPLIHIKAMCSPLGVGNKLIKFSIKTKFSKVPFWSFPFLYWKKCNVIHKFLIVVFTKNTKSN